MMTDAQSYVRSDRAAAPGRAGHETLMSQIRQNNAFTQQVRGPLIGTNGHILMITYNVEYMIYAPNSGSITCTPNLVRNY